jgi:hypothetical protein
VKDRAMDCILSLCHLYCNNGGYMKSQYRLKQKYSNNITLSVPSGDNQAVTPDDDDDQIRFIFSEANYPISA